jgi:quercetin dioxygenase-like cupin family protein
MANYTVSLDQVETTELPGRTVKVLSDALPVKNLTVGVCEVPPHSAMTPHSHVQEELIFFLQGHGYVNVGGTEEQVSPGTLVYFPSNLEHFTVNESNEVMKFTFSFSPKVVVGSYDRKSEIDE